MSSSLLQQLLSMHGCATRLTVLSVSVLILAVACGDEDSAASGAMDELGGASGQPSEQGPGGVTDGGGGARLGGPGAAGAEVEPSEGGSGAGGGAAGAPSAVDCSRLATVPAKVEILTGFASSEDFVFDELGNYVGVDGDSNLVRISKTGKRELWAPRIGDTAGMAILPDGSVIFADVTNSSLRRMYPNGASEVVIGGLLYPNGVDVGPDGFIYVAENFGGRVRRVNPDTGESTVVAMGLYGPNGVAVTDDPRLLYVGSFEGGGVYKVEIAEPGQLGVATVFARPEGSPLPEPKLECPDQIVGKECSIAITGDPGLCQQVSNVIDCVAAPPCEGKADGAACPYGTCQQGACISTCETDPELATCPCQGLKEGDTCLVPGAPSPPGACRPGVGGSLECVQPAPCEGKVDGAVCALAPEASGKCRAGLCEVDLCANAEAGDDCWSGRAKGQCEGAQGGPLSCVAPCAGKLDGAACTVGQWQGQCLRAECALPCSADTLGARCIAAGEAGTCSAAADGAACTPDEASGGYGIDGLGVDACGFVYATEYTSGRVWRISPAGEMVKLAGLPSGWIPNIKWGRGVGGFERDVMYVADRDESRLFAISVGVPGVTEYYDIGAPR